MQKCWRLQQRLLLLLLGRAAAWRLHVHTARQQEAPVQLLAAARVPAQQQ
jgi:hypothetical protein